MIVLLTAFALIIIACLFLNKVSGKIGVPALLLFLLLGMIIPVSRTGLGDDVQWFVRDLCTVALIFIMFYGGFGTRWSSAKTAVKDSAFLATFGVAITAGMVGLFCHFALKWDWAESFLTQSASDTIRAQQNTAATQSSESRKKQNTVSHASRCSKHTKSVRKREFSTSVFTQWLHQTN